MRNAPDGYFVQDVEANSYLVDDVSLSMLGVLMESPRIPLTTLAHVVQASSTAVRRRWEELQRTGLAWSSALPAADPKVSTQALIHVSVEPDAHEDVVEELKHNPQITSMYELLSDPTLLLTTVAPNPQRLSQNAIEPLRANPHLRVRKVSLVTKRHRSGANWRPIALTETQRQRLDLVGRNDAQESSDLCFEHDDFNALQLLARDARIGSSELARQTGENRSAAGRRLSRILNNKCLQPRTFIAPGLIGLPLRVFWFAHVPTAHYRRTLRTLAKLPQIASMLSTTGQYNLAFSIGMHSLDQVYQFEQYLQRLVPSLEILESRTVVYTHKRWGWLLNPNGTRTGEFIPLSYDAWMGTDARLMRANGVEFDS